MLKKIGYWRQLSSVVCNWRLIELNILLCLCDRTADTIETHGYYQHGTGFPAVNGAPKLQPFGANLPIKVLLPHFFELPKWRCREVSKKEGLRKCMDLYGNFRCNIGTTALTAISGIRQKHTELWPVCWTTCARKTLTYCFPWLTFHQGMVIPSYPIRPRSELMSSTLPR